MNYNDIFLSAENTILKYTLSKKSVWNVVAAIIEDANETKQRLKLWEKELLTQLKKIIDTYSLDISDILEFHEEQDDELLLAKIACFSTLNETWNIEIYEKLDMIDKFRIAGKCFLSMRFIDIKTGDNVNIEFPIFSECLETHSIIKKKYTPSRFNLQFDYDPDMPSNLFNIINQQLVDAFHNIDNEEMEPHEIRVYFYPENSMKIHSDISDKMKKLGVSKEKISEIKQWGFEFLLLESYIENSQEIPSYSQEYSWSDELLLILNELEELEKYSDPRLDIEIIMFDD